MQLKTCRVEGKLTKAENKLVSASLAFCDAQETINFLKRARERCTKRDDYATDFIGGGPCDINNPEAARCRACEQRFQDRDRYLAALRKRKQAKLRMMVWSRRAAS